MIELLTVFLSVAVGLVAGHVGHEFAHYAVLQAAGYDPSIQGVPLRVTWSTPVPIPAAVRLAAVAPAILGVGVVLATVAIYAVAPALLPVCVGSIIALFQLSPADRDIALGRSRRLS